MSDDTPPVPVIATFKVSTGEMTVTFDQPLQPVALDAALWIPIADRTDWRPLSGSTAGLSATCFFTDIGPGPMGANVTYAPPPFQIVGTNGLPAPSFSKFPMTVTP